MKKVVLGSQEELAPSLVDWRSVSMVDGDQCVPMSLMIRMPWWLVSSLDSMQWMHSMRGMGNWCACTNVILCVFAIITT